MLIIAHHHIIDPDKFWAAAKEVTPNLPSNLKLHAVYPSMDLKTGTCIWEAPTVEEVQNFLDGSVADVSKNFCYEINETMAIGLPQKAMEETIS